MFPQSIDPLIDFGFCSGDSELVAKSRDEFLRPIRGVVRSRSPQDLKLNQCTAAVGHGKAKIIIADSDVPVPDDGIVIKPSSGGRVGSINFKWRDREGKLGDYTLIYKDTLDLFSVILGGVDGYKFKNKLMFEGLHELAKEEARRAGIMANTFSDPELNKQDCVPVYNRLRQKTGGEFGSLLSSVLTLQNYNDPVEMGRFLGLMDEVNGIYSELKSVGCE